MTIAVNACILPGQLPGSDGYFLINCCAALAKQFPRHHFIFITDTEPSIPFPAEKNCSTVISGPQIKNPLLLQYWLSYKIPAILRKQQVDVFLSMGVAAMRSKIPQCVFINDLCFLQQQNGIAKTWLRFYKKNTPQYLSKAKTIAAASAFVKNEITDAFKISDDEIDLLHKGVSTLFAPAGWQQKENIKAQYTSGKEYFLYSGTIDSQHNLINLLKAFSFFKKRQKSNMQLVLASAYPITDAAFTKSLSSYKYKDEVKLMERCSIETLANVTASTYALVYPVLYEGFCAAAAEAMQCGTPVITSNTSSMPEICGDAALYANPADFNDIADKMMLIFKDEDKKNELAAKGLLRATAFSREKTIDGLWQLLVNTTK